MMPRHHVRSRSRTLLFLLSIILTFTFTFPFTFAHIETDENHDMLSMITPLSKVSKYETIPRIIPTSASQTRANQRHPHLLYYEFKAINRTWKVKAELNHDLFAPSYQELVWVKGKGLVPQDGPQSHHDHCYYIGHVTNALNASASNSAALHTCKGVHGIIHADNMMLHVQPSLTDSSHSIVFLDEHVKRGPRHHKCKHDHDIDNVEMDITSTSTTTSHLSSHRFQSLQNMDLGRTRWVELIIVNDRANFAQLRAGTTRESSNIANQVDALYYNAKLTPPLRVRLVAQITFQDEDPYQKLLAFHPNGEVDVDSLLAAFTKWSADPANNLPAHDNHQLISGLNFEKNVVGYAPVSQMCNIQNSAAIVSHATQDWIGTALTSTHEMGHNLGMIHDGPPGNCPTSGFVMAASSTPGLNITEFSVCSKAAYQQWYQQEGYKRDPNACLENVPTRTWAIGVCGDGKLEGEEECDCGPANSTECRERQPCCIPSTCKFKPGATCSKADACCNIETCQVRPKGTVCRAQRDRTCDDVETCDGTKPTCPDDTYKVAGGICNDTYSPTGGRCYQGFCLSLDKLCSQFGAGYRACPTSLLPDPTATLSCRQSYCLLNGSTTCEAKPDPSKTPGTIPDGYGCDTGKQCQSAKCVTSDNLDHPPVPIAPPPPIGTNGGITNPLTENNNLVTILVIIAAVAIALSVLLCVYRRCRRQQAKRDIASGRVRYAAPGVYVDEPGIYVAPPLNHQNIQLNVYNSQPPSNQILSNGLTVEEAMAIQQMQLADAQRAEQMKQEQAAAEAARAREISIEPAEPARPIQFASDEEAIQALLAQEEADRRARDARRAEAGLPPLNEPLSADEKLIRDLLAKDAEALKLRERRSNGGSVTQPKNIPVVPTIVATPAPAPASVPISFSPAPAGAPGGISIAAAADLPRGWTEHKTSQGVQYWFNSVTGKTAWSRPTE